MTSAVEAAPVTTPAAQRSHLMGGMKDLSTARTIDEALKLAGLDWEPVLSPAETWFKGQLISLNGNAVLRSDTGKQLGKVVSDGYVPVGNRELAEFAQALVDEAGIPWEAGGALGGGELPYFFFRLPDGIQIAGQDPIDGRIMVANGHGGNAALTGTLVPFRPFCANQVRASRLAYANFRIRHSGDIESKIGEAREVLQLTTKYMREFEVIANQLADIDVDVSFFEDFVDELIPIDPDAGVRTAAARNRQRAQFRQNWNATETLDPDLKATGWGAFNVITEVIDHGSLGVRKSSTSADERKFKDVFLGSGAKLRDNAFDLLTAELETPGGIRERARERKLVAASAN